MENTPLSMILWGKIFSKGGGSVTPGLHRDCGLALEDFSAEANTLYEINVLDNRAVVGSWAVTP